VDLHPFVGETTPQSNVVGGDPSKHNEPKKKKPRKIKWEINLITKIDGLLGLFGLSLCV
jgi:hypothetical protein